jgi:hypothetical protein
MTMTIHPLIRAYFAATGPRYDRTPLDWQGSACSICQTREGRMYCAGECDGHCDTPATPERIAAAKSYNAQRRRNNALAVREYRRIEPKRSDEAIAEERRSVG